MIRKSIICFLVMLTIFSSVLTPLVYAETQEPLSYNEIIFKNKDILKEYIDEGLDASKLNHRNEILRYQANFNLVADGIFGNISKDVFYNNYEVVDLIPEEMKNKEWFIVVNTENRVLTVYKNGEIYKKYPIAVGKDSTKTPSHKFTIVNKSINPYWGGMFGKYKPIKGGAPNNPLGKRWMGLSTEKYRGYGIHGNADPYSIGKRISAGCIRMINEDIEELFEYMTIGTDVWTGTNDKLKEWGILQKYKAISL